MADQALVLFGMPDAVTAHLDVIRPGSQVVDYYDLRLHYPGVKVLLRCSYLVLEEGPRYILNGTEGSFLKWGIDPQEEDLKKGILPGSKGWGEEPADMHGMLRTLVNGEDKKEKVPTLPGDYMAFYDNLYRAIRHGEPLAVQPQEARNVIRVLEAALESSKSRRTVIL
jgi:predicted dehydrogenase